MHGEALTLALWEGAAGRRGLAREAALLDATPRSLPERNLLALRRYAHLFGAELELVGRCPHCRAAVEFTIDAVDCADAMEGGPAAPAAAEWHVLETDAAPLRFRLPGPADLGALDAVEDPADFAESLLARCIDGPLPDAAARDAISRRMEALMPGAVVSFSLLCPDCGGGWSAPLDPVELLWRELRLRAESLLGDVAVLARGFGWSEREILELGAVRRAAYLQLLAA
ncbi:hypothetical protein [Pseudoxanthomonas sp. 10H]|uniref:hypothetical protein n=1 Tax=Pseudoxanthomonas sp. 10H TaxID=3242729 RepID=UPI003559295D